MLPVGYDILAGGNSTNSSSSYSPHLQIESEYGSPQKLYQIIICPLLNLPKETVLRSCRWRTGRE